MKRDIAAELKPIFYPRGVAIVGASNREGNFGDLVAEAVTAANKPAALVSMGLMPMPPQKGAAIYPDGRRAAMALGKLLDYKRFREDD